MRYLKPCSARKMSSNEAAWLAGFFDGEGSICSFKAKGRYKSWVFSLPNTHLPALERCQEIAGCGKIYFHSPRQAKQKEYWQYQIMAKEDIAATLKQLLPYLIVKKEAAELFLNDHKPQMI